MSTIKVEGITKDYGAVKALDNLSVTFEENKIYGLLGRNGAGKTTLLNLISNRIFPTSGKVTVDGEPLMENESALSKIYCMTEKTLYEDSCRVSEAFRLTKDFYPNFNNDYALELSNKFGLNTKCKIKSLSTGYSSIFKIVIALACNAPIVLFDEPVLGLDANHRDLFYKELIEQYAENPRTFIISTHLIEEIADIIEKIVIIKNGRLLVDDYTENVKKMGYGVSGSAEDVDKFILGKNVLSTETLGALKYAAILGEKPADVPSLSFTAIDLQKLFISLTNS